MANGKNGTTCWLAGAVRTLMKRVEMLDPSDSFKNVDRNIHVNTSVPRSKVRVPGHKPAADLEHEDDFKQELKMDLPIRQFPGLQCGARMLLVHWMSLM